MLLKLLNLLLFLCMYMYVCLWVCMCTLTFSWTLHTIHWFIFYKHYYNKAAWCEAFDFTVSINTEFTLYNPRSRFILKIQDILGANITHKKYLNRQMEGETYTLFPKLRKQSFIYTNIIISKLVKEEENLKEILIEFFFNFTQNNPWKK